MQIPPGQAALPPNPVPPAPTLTPPERAQAIEPTRQVTPSREDRETSDKSRSHSEESETSSHGTHHRRGSSSRGGLIDVTI
ncbi:MAG TPA: hypothetical protein VMU85_03420 [Stellaceae bacterium]|nr:hypothetical protein [Stellaceae bacterium]